MDLTSALNKKQHANAKQETAVSDEVLVSLRRIIQAIDLHSRQLARQHGITTPQLLILKQIQSEGSISVSRLAEQVSLKQATVTDILNRLERKGLVRREKDQRDRRKVLLQETDAGRKLLEAAPSPLQETFLYKFANLEKWKQTMILTSIQLLESLMVEKTISAAPILSTGSLTDSAELFVEKTIANSKEQQR